MKVLHIITGLGTGGAEAMLYKLISHSDNPENQTVVSLTSGGKHRELLEQLGVSVYELDLKKVWLFPVRFIKLINLVSAHKVQVINAWMYHPILIATWLIMACGSEKPKLLWNIRHSLPDLSHEKRSLRVIIRLLSRLTNRPDNIIFNSQKSATEHAKYWNMLGKEYFIPNGFDTDKWQPKTAGEKKLKQVLKVGDALLLGHVGRVHPMKNHAGLIRSFIQLQSRFPRVYLLLIGKGTDSLEFEISTLTDHIIILGERSDVEELVSDLDFFVLCSVWGEGFPNVLGEAMACGLPCITTDVGDSAFLLGQPEWIVPANDEQGLTDKLEQLLSLSDENRIALGSKNRERILKNFTMQSVEKYYQQVYVSGVSTSHNVN